MRLKSSYLAAPLFCFIACAFAVGLTAPPAAANVYATDLKWSAPSVLAAGGSVGLSFRLNEPADQITRIEIYRGDTNALVRTVNLGPQPRGLVNYNWDLKNDAAVAVPTNVEYYFKVFVRATGYGAWTQISNDNDQAGKFYHARGIYVNQDPNSPWFGRIYVNNSLAGTTTAAPDPQRTLGDGLYALNADVTDAIGQGDSAMGGGVAWEAGSGSPYKIVVGPAGKVYMFDWTDLHGGVWVAPPDLSGNFIALLSPATLSNSGGGGTFPFDNGALSPPAVHGSIGGGFVEGKGLNRTLYTIDEDITPADGSIVIGKGSIWKYAIGPLDQEYTQPPVVVWDDSDFNTNVNLNSNVKRDAQGNFFATQYRSNGTDESSLWKISPDGSSILWGSLENWGSPDPLRNNVGNGLAIDSDRGRIAVPALNVTNVLSTSLDKTTLTTIGGGAVLYAAGDSSQLLYSANAAAATPTFTDQAEPVAGIQLNDNWIDYIGTAAGGTNGWAVGNGGNIFKLSENANWTSEASTTTQNLNGVVAIWNATTPPVVHGWAVGDNGTIVKNLAGAWEADNSPFASNINSIGRRVSSYAGPNYDLFIVGDGGTIARKLAAEAAESTWETVTSGTTQNLNAISVLVFSLGSNTIAYTVGDNGTILKTTDAAVTWSPLTSGTSVKLNGVYAQTGTDAWAVGDNGTILRTSNGTSWTAQTSGVTDNLYDVWFKDNQMGWVVGANGTILRTTNGGSTWVKLTGTGTSTLRGVSARQTGGGSLRETAFDVVGNLYVGDVGTELMRIYSPPDGQNEYTTKSYGTFVPAATNATKPATPVVTAPASSASSSQLSASWTVAAPPPPIAGYRYAIGVTPEDQGDYVVPWTNSATNNVTKTGLSLQNGVTYFWYVQAKSDNGVWSDVGVSGGTLVQAPDKIGSAKKLADNALVSLVDVVVTKSTSTEFWVQEQDRSAGVRVLSTANPPVNTLVSLTGSMKTDGTTTERYVDSTSGSVTVGSAHTPEPVNLINKTAAGDLATGGAGLANDGLLAMTWGKVTGVDFTIPQSIYIDDGSGVANDTPIGTVTQQILGVKVITDDFVSEGDYVTAIGIVRLKKLGDNSVIRIIETRGFGDVVKKD